MPSDNAGMTSGSGAAEEISRTLEGFGLPVATEYRGGRIHLEGEVDSPENRQAILDVAHGIADPLGIPLVEDLTLVPDFPGLPDEAMGSEDLGGFAYLPSVEDADLELEPDFDDPVETEVTEDTEAYFPPTDPVVRPSTGPEKLEILGGFGATSMDPELRDDDAAGPPGDEELTEIVLRELREDALTTDMRLEVETVNRVVILRGEVDSPEDAENAVAVAGRIDWVEDVEDGLVVRPAGAR
jgi:hypothetical protein